MAQKRTVRIVRKAAPVKKVVRLQQGGLVSPTGSTLPSRPTGKKTGVKRIYYC